MRRGRGRVRDAVGAVAGIALLATVATACIPPRPSPSATVAPLVTPAPTSSGPAGPSPEAGVVVADPTLLDLLPAEVAGVPLESDPESATDIAAQTTAEGLITPFVSGIAIARAFAPQATDTATDYVVVTVARLRRAAFLDLVYREWRQTFDAAVCEQAGGVVGVTAETVIADHRTYIGTCAGGVHTYHVHLADRDVLLSMQGAGDGRFAERVIEGLTE
ncbi:MAG: hypothetical protein ACXW4L_03915 [Candidatus Limnocylindrales bacterium]